MNLPPNSVEWPPVIDWVDVPFEVPGQSDGLRLDAFLAARLRRYSRAEVQRLIDAGRVEAGTSHPKPSRRVRSGERIVVRYPRRDEGPVRHSVLPVLYEDEALLAVDKPGDLLSHPTDKVHKNTATAVMAAQAPGVGLRLVHRLDRETSGVLLFAKDAAAARSLVAQFSLRRTRKEYLALAAGEAAFSRRTVDEPIGREGGAIKVRQAVAERGAGQAARTEFERLGVGGGISLIRARPGTGRLHQIRVHLAWLGHPVLGDKLYTGGGEAYMKAVRKELCAEDIALLGAPRQMLHAWKLAFEHPMTGRPVEVVAPLPADFCSRMGSAGIDWNPR